MSAITLDGCVFSPIGPLAPACDAAGRIIEHRPQANYAKRAVEPLHKHGSGTFCTFRIAVPQGLVGVYALVVGGSIRYVGECVDLGKRFNTGYGNISPRNCYKGGQPTNCKINHRVLEVATTGGQVDLYFHPTPQRKVVEQQLIARFAPPWND